jgi:Zn-dependent M28 family amino/carboxypeptidase
MISLGLLFSFSNSYLDAVQADDLKRIVYYLASDELKGRGTPSPELDKAADFIAEEFKKGGAQPGNGQSFFQETEWKGRTGEGQKVRNVIAIIPGSDPELSKQYVIVSAHYDHLGEAKQGEGDKIYNGADDDASGVAGVIGVGKALAKEKPKRTVVLMTFYGEEKGLVGSRYYVEHPVFPLKNTVANINLEQIGRTDDTEGARVAAGSLTGFNFSSIGTTFAKVGKDMGVPVTGHPQFSAAFFVASDNYSFARAGVPAHTLCTAFEFPDYHKVGDSADKLDYVNMEKIVKLTAATVLEIVNAKNKPAWNAEEKAATRFIEAAKKLEEGK